MRLALTASIYSPMHLLHYALTRNQWWSGLGRSASRNLRYSSAFCASPLDAASAGLDDEPRVGSSASNLAMSAARSVGSWGALGAAGAEKVRTAEAWASAACC